MKSPTIEANAKTQVAEPPKKATKTAHSIGKNKKIKKRSIQNMNEWALHYMADNDNFEWTHEWAYTCLKATASWRNLGVKP